METKQHGAVSDLIITLNCTSVLSKVLADGGSLLGDSLGNYIGKFCSEGFMCTMQRMLYWELTVFIRRISRCLNKTA
jgi:hypothetical protein